MNITHMPLKILTAMWILALLSPLADNAQEMDSELSKLADKLASTIKEHGNKKVAVVDFADLQGSSSGELGKYIAEQLTVDLVMGKRDFAVLDRANLRSILAEHKLTSSGLVDPQNAKKLGMFAGVDALILGTIIPKGQTINLTAKVITTDTAEIVGAARAEFKSDSNVTQLASHPEPKGGASTGPKDEKPKFTKTFGDLRCDVEKLRIVNGDQLVLTILLTNQSPKRTMWVAVSTDLYGTPKARITDRGGFEFFPMHGSVSGVEAGCFTQYGYQPNTFSPATELKPNDSTLATVRFGSRDQRAADPGSFRLQIEILMGRNYTQRAAGAVTVDNLTAQIEAE